MRGVDVSIVTYRPDFPLLESLVASIAEQVAGLAVNVLIQDNSPDPETTERIAALPALGAGGPFARVDVVHSPVNVGFGRGHNANAARGTAAFLFVLNQDCVLEPGVLPRARRARRATDDARVAAWELRQIPYEHPKAYDPVTLDVPWVERRGDALPPQRVRRGGRLRSATSSCTARTSTCRGGCARGVCGCATCRGSRSCTAPTARRGSEAAAGLRRRAHEPLPARALRRRDAHAAGARHAGGGDRSCRRTFPGGARGSSKVLFGFLAQWPHFARTRVRPTRDFQPHVRRLGLRDAPRRRVRARSTRAARQPRARPAAGVDPDPHRRPRRRGCAQALESVREPDLAEPRGRRGRGRPARVARRRRALPRPPRRCATTRRATRSDARAPATSRSPRRAASGSTSSTTTTSCSPTTSRCCVDAAQRAGAKGAYGLAWETQTDVRRPRERAATTRSCTMPRATASRFDRLTLWHHNYLPIQAVLFHRSPLRAPRRLRRGHGPARGLEPVDALHARGRFRAGREDDVQVPRARQRARRRRAAGAARQRLRATRVERQRELRVTVSPREISRDGRRYVRSAVARDGQPQRRAPLRRIAPAARAARRVAAIRVAAQAAAPREPRDDERARVHRRALHPRRAAARSGRALAPLPLRRVARRRPRGPRRRLRRGLRQRAARAPRRAASPAPTSRRRPSTTRAPATRRCANLEFRQADCAALPFADACFDVVVSFETIEHIAAQDAFLDEVRARAAPERPRSSCRAPTRSSTPTSAA